MSGGRKLPKGVTVYHGARKFVGTVPEGILPAAVKVAVPDKPRRKRAAKPSKK